MTIPHSVTCPECCDAPCECPHPGAVFGNITKMWYDYECGHDLPGFAPPATDARHFLGEGIAAWSERTGAGWTLVGAITWPSRRVMARLLSPAEQEAIDAASVRRAAADPYVAACEAESDAEDRFRERSGLPPAWTGGRER